MIARFSLLLTFLIGALSIPAAAQDDTTRPVKLITVETRDAQNERVFFGRVVAKETVDLAFQVSGQLVSIPVTQGEIVPAGSMVAQLDLEPFELVHEQAELQKAQAERTLERYNQLISSSTVSRVVLEDAETAAGLADVSLRNAEFNLEHATIYAPFDAIVAERLVANFTTVNPGMPVVTLHDMSDLRIEIDVPEVLFQRAGSDANVVMTAEFPASDKVYPVVLREFRAESSEIGQTFKVVLGMPPQPDLDLLPGASATVRARLAGEVIPPTIPSSAVAIAGDGTTSVMVFEPSDSDPNIGTLKRQEIQVTPGPRGGLLVSDGLDSGAQIVASGLVYLEDGMRVSRFQGFPE